MKKVEIAEKDFSEWVEVAEKNPDDFEAMRLAAIEEFIESVPEEQRERLRRLQWRIDQERRLAKTPMNACVRISRMMWRSVVGEGGLRDRFSELGGLLQGETPKPQALEEARPARVLAFGRE